MKGLSSGQGALSDEHSLQELGRAVIPPRIIQVLELKPAVGPAPSASVGEARHLARVHITL